MKERDYSLDVLRILACFMVVLMHSPLPAGNAPGVFLTGLSYLTAPCIGLFFMVSGALLLPVRTDYFTFLKRRFGKIVIPTLFWSLIYMGLKLYRSESEINIVQSLASLPLVPRGEGVLWFMYTLAGLYLLAPVLSAWIEKASRRELQFVLMLWGVTLFYPIFNFFLITNSSTTGILYYFAGYGGYFLLGCYLKRYPDSLSTGFLWVITLSGVALLLCLKHFAVEFDFYQLFWYESIFIVAFAAVIWKTVGKTINRFQINRFGWLIGLSNISFGIYLIHILIMRHWLWQMEWIQGIANYQLQTFTVATLTIILSIISCTLIARFPKADWIIGYKHLSK